MIWYFLMGILVGFIALFLIWCLCRISAKSENLNVHPESFFRRGE